MAELLENSILARSPSLHAYSPSSCQSHSVTWSLLNLFETQTHTCSHRKLYTRWLRVTEPELRVMMFILSLTLHTGNEHTVAALLPTVAAKQLNVVLEQQLQHRVYGMSWHSGVALHL